jgi:hypothetical protein
MDSKLTEKTRKTKESGTSYADAQLEPDPDLPRYYDSEPSSQPPKYDKAATPATSTTPRSSLQPPTRPQAHHTGSGAPAATVAALLASSEPETRDKKPLRERWKDFKERNFHSDISDAGNWDKTTRGSSSQWNAFGASVQGYDGQRIRGEPQKHNKRDWER